MILKEAKKLVEELKLELVSPVTITILIDRYATDEWTPIEERTVVGLTSLFIVNGNNYVNRSSDFKEFKEHLLKQLKEHGR